MQAWVYEGRIYPYIGLNAVAGKRPEEYGVEPVRYDDMIPGCYDPKARVVDMDIDGIEAMLCFPSFPRFGGAIFAEGEDKATRALECAGVERLPPRRVVRHRPGPLHPDGHAAAVGLRR